MGLFLCQVGYTWLRWLTDPFMTPFLVPLLDCNPDSAMSRSVHARGWTVLVSAIVDYVFLLVSWFFISLLSMRLNGSSLLRLFISLNRVLLPGVAFWTVKIAFYCRAEDASSFDSEFCEYRMETLQDPHVLLSVCGYLLIVVCMENYAFWAQRHDFFLVAYRQQFGVLCGGIYREYLIWPIFENCFLILSMMVLGLLDALGLNMIELELFASIQALNFLLLQTFSPHLIAALRSFKVKIAAQKTLLPLLTIGQRIFVSALGSGEILPFLYDLLLGCVFFFLLEGASFYLNRQMCIADLKLETDFISGLLNL